MATKLKMLVVAAAATIAATAVPTAAQTVQTSGNQSLFDSQRPGIATGAFAFAAPTGTALGTNEKGSYSLGGVKFTATNLTGFNDGYYGKGVSYLGSVSYLNGNGIESFSPTLTVTFGGPVLGLLLGSVDAAQTISYVVNGQAHTVAVPVATGTSAGTTFLGFDTGKANSSLTVTFTGLTNELDIVGVQTAVPEPAAWATMMLGVGAIGATLRRRRGRATARVALA